MSRATRENHKLASSLARLNEIKQLLGANSYEDAAYTKAIRWVLAAPELVSEEALDKALARSQGLSAPGKSIRGKILEFIWTGRIAELESLESQEEVKAAGQFSKILGVGSATLREWLDAGYRSPSEVLAAYQAGRLSLTALQRAGLRYREDLSERIPRVEVEEIASSVSHALARNLQSRNLRRDSSSSRARGHAPRMIIAGSYRRGAASSGDVDIILEIPSWVSSKSAVPRRGDSGFSPRRGNSKLALHGSPKNKNSPGRDFPAGPQEKVRVSPREYLAGIVAELNPVEILSLGPTKAMLLVRGRENKIRQLDLLLAEPQEIPTMLAYFTGSAGHNEMLRGVAKKLGFTLNQYGLFSDKGSGKPRRFHTPTEASIYEALGLKYIPPGSRG